MKRKIIFTILIIIVVAGTYCLFFGNDKKPDREYLNQKGKFTIGLYLGRTIDDSLTKSIYYEYEVEGKSYQLFDTECYLDSDKANDHFYFKNYPLLKGNLFVILYDSINPERSIIRLDHPLKDSVDFKRNILKIEKERDESKESGQKIKEEE